MTTCYHAQQIFYDNKMLFDQYLLVEEGKIVGIQDQAPADMDCEDFGQSIIAPGYVETHIHGFAGHDVMDNDPEGLKAMAEGLLSTGVTSWLATTLTDSREHLNQVCQMVGQTYQEVQGAKIQGIFLEGPFFTEKYKGAQNPKYMGDPKVEILAEWDDLSNHLVKKIAIAGERDGVAEFIKFAKSRGIKVALAHSDATYDQTKAAVEEGADIFIHTYNGMSGLHHREPGMVGAALTLDQVFAEVICDGHHVHPAAAKLVFKARGADQMILITDSMRAAGQGEGPSRLGEFEVMVKDGAARLVNGGSLAGSVLEMKTAVKNVVDWGICSVEEALKMASYTPAKSVGIEDQCGKLAKGYPADFIVLSPDLELKATYLDGLKRY